MTGELKISWRGRWEESGDLTVALAETVDEDGQVFLLVMDRKAPATPSGATETARCVDCPPDHEQLGPLPLEIEQRLGGRPYDYGAECGAPTKTTGRPCRIWVETEGERCHLHRDPPTPAPPMVRSFPAKFAGKCWWCSKSFDAGESIARLTLTGESPVRWGHPECAQAAAETRTEAL